MFMKKRLAAAGGGGGGSGTVRPWDKNKKGRRAARAQAGAGAAGSGNNATSTELEPQQPGVIPPPGSVTVDSTVYCSDRFYLNGSLLDDDYYCGGGIGGGGGGGKEEDDDDETEQQQDDDDGKKKKKKGDADHDADCCSCGAQGPPPLLDRSRLVASLDLEAAVLGTYGLDLHWLRREFPALVGPGATVPTLLLHGRKGQHQHRQGGGGTNKNNDDTNNTTKKKSKSTPNKGKKKKYNWQQHLKSNKKKKGADYHHDNDEESGGDGEEDTEEEEDMEEEQKDYRRTGSSRKEVGGSSGSSGLVVDTAGLVDGGCVKSDDDDDIGDSDDGDSLCTQPEEIISFKCGDNRLDKENAAAAAAAAAGGAEELRTKPPPPLPRVSTTPPTAANHPSTSASSSSSHRPRRRSLPGTLHLTEVLPTWIPPTRVPSKQIPLVTPIVEDGIGGSGGGGCVTRAVVDARQYKMGVHHPKFMVLFEKSGSVVVLVSTANLTRPLSNDATWVQRFHPLSTAASSKAEGTSNNSGDASDLGATLAHFLQCETLACREGQLTPLGFVRRYLGWSCLAELGRRYDFSTAQVHLVATVPGDHEGPDSYLVRQNNSKNKGNGNAFAYGRQRVAQVVGRLSTPLSSQTRRQQPWLPPAILSDKDRLVFQPTSFGADWNRGNMADVVRSYLADCAPTTTDVMDDATDQALLERLDIVWPTDDFVQGAREYRKVAVKNNYDDYNGDGDDEGEEQSDSPDSATAAKMGFATATASSTSNGGDQELETERGGGGHLFLSSETFNKIDLSCLSRMVMFEPSVPEQRSSVLVPHIKTVARLFDGKDYRLRKDWGLGVKAAEETFPWFLLTSACLSRGAQGDVPARRAPGSNALVYNNFELGILFCSRLQGSGQTDRLYCSNPSQCTCQHPPAERRPKGPRLIHLPAPFSFRPSRYQEDEDELEDFCETPYFHEIPRGTAVGGNLFITPYGKAVAAKFEAEA